MKFLDNNLIQAYYIALMLGIDLDMYEIDEKSNNLFNTEIEEKANENDLTFILDSIETMLENTNKDKEEDEDTNK